MKFSSSPFSVVLLASGCPIFAAATNNVEITYLPDIVTVVIGLILFCTQGRKAKINNAVLIVLGFICLHMAFNLIYGRGVGSGGLISLLVTSFIFYKFLESDSSDLLASKIYCQLTVIYAAHIIFIIIELALRLNGFTDQIVSVIGQIPGEIGNIKKYKTYNSAMFLNYLGNHEISGMNSLLLGSQSASQLTAFAILFFSPTFKVNQLIKKPNSNIKWFLISLILFPFVASMTATLILAVITLTLVFIFPDRTLNNNFIKIMFFLVGVIYASEILSLIAFRVVEPEHWMIYIEAFSGAPIAYLDLSISEQLMGFGSHLREAEILAADFGFGMLMFQVGLIFIALVIFIFIKLITQSFSIIRAHINGGVNSNPWIQLLSINLIIAIGWLLSLSHYTPAIECGGRQIFAFHLGVCFLALKKSRLMLRTGVQL